MNFPGLVVGLAFLQRSLTFAVIPAKAEIQCLFPQNSPLQNRKNVNTRSNLYGHFTMNGFSTLPEFPALSKTVAVTRSLSSVPLGGSQLKT